MPGVNAIDAPPAVTLWPMNKQDLAKMLARQSHRSRGQAADAVDTLVYDILKDLKDSQKREGPSSDRGTRQLPRPSAKAKQ
jgi:hypothetical protein